MGSIALFLIFSLFMPSGVQAASPDEIYQVISFTWEDSEQKLVPFSIGSGTSVHQLGLVTNRHVVHNKETKKNVDLVLLCKAQRNRSQRSDCSIPAVVTAFHPEMDVALIQPVDGDPLLPAAAPETLKQKKGDTTRVYAFPYSTSQDEFGDRNTLDKLKQWMKRGGTLMGLGDKLTVTRGTIKTIYRDSFGNVAYYGTDAKGDFGSSGGGAFTNTGKYMGIPSYKDTEGNAILIAYSEIHDWLHEKKNLKGSLKPEVLAYYEKHIAPEPSIFEQQRKSITRRYPRTTKKSPSQSYRQSRTTQSVRFWPRVQKSTSHKKTIYRPRGRLRYLGEP